MNQSETILRGNIEKVFYAGPKFSAGRLRGMDGKSHSFAGNLFATEGQHIALAGRWEAHPDYGSQFKVDHVVIEMPLGAEGLAQFIANHPDARGIGPSRAAKIALAFGDDFERVLLESPERIAQAVRMPLHTIENLRNVWIASRKFNAAMTWLSAFGLTHHQVTTLIKKLGNNALAILRDDPYRLMREIKGLGFKKVDQIARKMGMAKEHQPRIRAGILHCIHEALGQGDCWVELEELVERANLLLIMDCLDSRERIEGELNVLIREKALQCVDMGGRVVAALPFIHEQESALAIFFKRGADKVCRIDGREMDEIIARACPTLNEKQDHAIRTALTRRISLISGGAGVGKSFCVSVIDSICEKLEIEVALTAPTGKAAKRLEELSGREARTIHRLLGYDGKAFAKGPDDPIDAEGLRALAAAIAVPIEQEIKRKGSAEKENDPVNRFPAERRSHGWRRLAFERSRKRSDERLLAAADQAHAAQGRAARLPEEADRQGALDFDRGRGSGAGGRQGRGRVPEGAASTRRRWSISRSSSTATSAR